MGIIYEQDIHLRPWSLNAWYNLPMKTLSPTLRGAVIGFVVGLIFTAFLFNPSLAMIGTLFGAFPSAAVLGFFTSTLGLSVNWMNSSVPVFLTPILYAAVGAFIGWLTKKP